MDDDLVYRLRKRAEIRRQIPTRKSVQEGKTDRLADLLDEAADVIESLEMKKIVFYKKNKGHIIRGNQAILVPIDHPSVTNGNTALTSLIVKYDKKAGIIETLNTVYVPDDESSV